MSTAAQHQQLQHDGTPPIVWHCPRPSLSSCAKHDCNNNGVPFSQQSVPVASRHCLARHTAAHPRKWPKHLQRRRRRHCAHCWPANNRISGQDGVGKANTWPSRDGTVFGQQHNQSATTTFNLLPRVCLLLPLLLMVLTMPSWMPGMSSTHIFAKADPNPLPRPQQEVQPRLAVFREVGDRLSGESDEDAIYEEVEYYLEEEEPPPTAMPTKMPVKGKKEKHRENGTANKAAEGKIGDEPEEATNQSSPSSDTEILSQLLNRGYDWRVRPPGTNLSLSGDHGPVVVNINMLIRSISKIDDVNMEYSAQLTFREEWVDGRLAFGLPKDNRPDHIILTAGQQIWMPDTFFQNEKQARKHEIDKPNVLIRIYKDGRILYSVRISLVLSCPMYLQYYPMDVQTCLIDMASYAYTDSDIEYRWKEEKPVQLKDGLASSLPSFQLTNVSTGYCTSKTNTGTYSCLRTVLILQRQFSYYLLQLYIPSSMLVIVSWVSFWLDRTAVPARVTLGVTTLLTMTTQTSGINAKLPPVSYSKAIDIWCGACLAFIFSALLEFACVTYISSRMFYKRRRNSRVMGRLPMYHNRHSPRRQSTCPNCHLEMPTAQLLTQRPSLRYTPLMSAQQYMDDESDEVWVRRKDVPPLALPASDTRKTSICLPPPDKDSSLLEHDMNRVSATSSTAKNQKRPNFLFALLRRLPPIRWLQRRLDAEVDPAKRADYISRILFPLAFTLFNLAYWFRYLML